MKFVLLMFVCCLLGGCLYMNVSMLDTAEPLRPAKPEIQFFTANGIDLDTAVFIPGEDYPPEQDPETNPHAKNGDISGTKIALGIGYDAELGVKRWVGEGAGYKYYLKRRIYHKGNHSVALSPAYYHLDKNETDMRKNVTGWELPLLFTYQPHKVLAGTLQFRYNRTDYLQKMKPSNGNPAYERGPFTIEHFGLIGGVNLRFWIISIYGDYGVEYIQAVNGPLTFLETSGLSIGLEF